MKAFVEKNILICMFCVCHPSGVVHQVKPIRGPRDLVLQVAMDYVKSGTVSYHSIAVIHVFISESLS